jgi:lipopolysaccharide biosynthesis glycosyltransferase
MDIAFCINRLGLIGLGGTLSSLIRNCSDHSRLKIWFMCAGLSNLEKNQVSRLLKAEKYLGTYEIIDFDPLVHFGSFASLHGDWSAYGRLLLADLLNEDQVLYLDSDLVVEVDVLEVEDFDFKGYILAAVGGGKYKYSLGEKFYINKLGISPDAEYFNSGVLLLNLQEWRLRNIKEECLRIARQYPMELPSHDESLLNIICAGNFAKLPSTFNCAWEAAQPKPKVADKMIMHFIGSPKPWDPLGAMLHNGYRNWFEYSDSEWSTFFHRLTFAELVRVWHIRRSYVRCIINRIKG